MQYILASTSPRRQELLKLVLEEPFIVQPSNADEHIDPCEPAMLVQLLAERKARKVAEGKADALIIGADTVVVLDGQILGKPKDRQDARQMLLALSGRTHAVYTGVFLLCTKNGKSLRLAERTLVTFAAMNSQEIEAYLDTGEYKDKAGAYGIQGGAAKHIRAISGCYFNVMGLPVHQTYELLKKIREE